MNPVSAPAAFEPQIRDPNDVVRVLTTFAQVEAIADDWRALEDRCSSAIVFQSLDFLRIWARHFTGSGQTLKIVTLWRDGRLVLIAPFVVTRHLGARIAHIAGHPVAEYGTFIHADGDCPPDAIDTVVETLARAGVDLLALDGVRSSTALAAFAERHRLLARNVRVAPYQLLSPDETHETYLRQRSKGLGKKLRARQRQLEEIGPVACEVVPAGPLARETVEITMSLKRGWLVARGAISTAFADTATAACLAELAETGAASVHRLTVGGRIIAARLAFVRTGTFHSYMSAYDEAFADYSPGRLLMNFSLASARAKGCTALDMFPPEGEHKSLWCDRNEAVADYLLPLTRRGRLHGAVYDDAILPMIHWTWSRMPESLRIFAATLLLHI